MPDPSIDILIPTCKPASSFEKLIECLEKQTVKPVNIRIINTQKEWWEQRIDTGSFLKAHPTVKLEHIDPVEFDHGATRHRGMEESQAEYVVCMTQDAMPADVHLLEELLKPFADPGVAVSYARQLPAEDASPIEIYTRSFNYPDENRVKGKEDITKLGIKTYMCSNVCAMYRKDIYDRQGGFIRHTIFNEDMIYAAGVIQKGYRIAYVADARVVHSHNYSGIQQFHRNFDLGVSQADHPEIFEAVPSESEGIKMVKQTAAYLCSHGKWYLLVKLIWQSGWKYLGYRTGKHYRKLSYKKILRYTMNPNYWKQDVTAADTN